MFLNRIIEQIENNARGKPVPHAGESMPVNPLQGMRTRPVAAQARARTGDAT
jgi:hypothetical protein